MEFWGAVDSAAPPLWHKVAACVCKTTTSSLSSLSSVSSVSLVLVMVVVVVVLSCSKRCGVQGTAFKARK